jgi:CO/xanthine dehydrogenase FAD-binding subunit
MIPFDFIYCRPDTLVQAVETYTQWTAEGKTALYYGGGSEVITMARAGDIKPDAVIDIKAIPELNELAQKDDHLAIGAACTLNAIKKSGLFPLMGLACGRIADHTNQCRITLGGNLCGTIIYRETSLPLLLSDARVALFGPQGEKTVEFRDIFRETMRVEPGEMVVSVHMPLWALTARYAHIKKTANEKIDYPLVNVTALWKDDVLRVAFSGICAFPFRSGAIEAVLNDRGLSPGARAEQAVSLLPAPPHDDVEGSGKYRAFVLQNTLRSLLEEWENGQI